RIDLIDPRPSLGTTPHRFTLLNLLVKDLREVLTAALQKVIRIGHDADARNVVFERDIPEPTTAAQLGAQHQCCAPIQIRLAMSSFEIRIEHRLLELWIAHAPAKL